MKEKRLQIFLQVGYWSVQVLLMIILLEAESRLERAVGHGWQYNLKWIATNLPFKLAIFYSYYHFFIPKWLRSRFFLFLLVTVAFLIGYPFLKMGVDHLVGIEGLQIIVFDDTEKENSQFWNGILRRLITVVFNISTAIIFRFSIDWFRNQRLASEAEKTRLEGELALLRHQVNPHFLFNTLNNIDSLVYKVSEEASEAIMKLSSIMRYMLYESATPYVQLSKEVEYLNSYVELERMRVKNKRNIQIESGLDNPTVKISPMVFIPFVENAFKHATPTSDGIKVSVRIVESKGVVHLNVVNSFDSGITIQKDNTGGIGLRNVKRRLELIYPERHSMSVNLDNNEYLLNLKIDLNDH